MTQRAAQRPNILLVTTDQQRGDCLSIAGHPALETPNMDFVGRWGTHFRRGYSETPICIPARRTIQSGQAPAVHGVLSNAGAVFEPGHTLAGELRDAGYHTYMVGKSHLGPNRKRFGFDHMVLSNSPRGRNNDYIDWLAQFGVPAPMDRWAVANGVSMNGYLGRPFHLDETRTHTFWCATEAIAFLSRRDPTAPFFLNLSFFDPHPPQAPPAYCFEHYDRMELPGRVVGDWAPDVPGPMHGEDPEAVKTTALLHVDDRAMHRWRAAYYGAIQHVDFQLGRVFQYMRETGSFDNTFILFTSDHGEMLGDHHMIGKSRPFEGSANVPFMCRPPRDWDYPVAQTLHAPVGLQDVMPTLLDAAGLPVPDTCTGRSVLPLVRGEAAESVGWREALHGEHAARYPTYGGMHYLTDGREKYAWFSQTGEELLFDLEADPREEHDLARTPGAGARLAAWRARLVDRLRDRPEGFVEGGRLVPGKKHGPLVPGVATPLRGAGDD